MGNSWTTENCIQVLVSEIPYMGQTLKQEKKKKKKKKKGKQVLMNQITCFFHIIRYLFVFKTLCMTDNQEDIAYHRLTLHHMIVLRLYKWSAQGLVDRVFASRVRGPRLWSPGPPLFFCTKIEETSVISKKINKSSLKLRNSPVKITKEIPGEDTPGPPK